MLDIISVYEDVVKDAANADQNGQISYKSFTRFSRRAELDLLDWLSGGVGNNRIPIPWQSQKNKDWLTQFIAREPLSVTGGKATRPADYYKFESLYLLNPIGGDCEDDEEGEYKESCEPSIDLLNTDQFNDRCATHIEELKPHNKPISKQVGKDFYFAPKDVGAVALEYIRYPKFGSITGKDDPDHNQEVVDVAVDYEWDEYARPFLIYLITDSFVNKTRERAGKEMNAASTPKTP